ncbi:acylphosphatase [Bifidobacterium sp. SO4]|uniref:acylphosphatase n=1 Tax=Bifidobacterium sp. SO4 TaxID=2809030 RepID=UPI001BDBD1A1|nr:acylphosphatase [Bifidobacterium sp. SO4]MBT1171353.1 acylphosphatase [Bifidobacterium sp. SO4]
MMDVVREHIVVTGMVQGVGFRYFAVMQARKLGVQGWVRNRLDGSVEAEAEGSGDAVELFVSALRQGPKWADVRAVEVKDMAPRQDTVGDFRVRGL